MGTISINLEPFYTNRAYYPYLPAAVFDALEAAYLEGKATALVPEAEYNVMLSNLKAASLCPGLS